MKPAHQNTLHEISLNALTHSELEVDRYTNEGHPPNTLVEGRNLLFLTYAGIFAKQKKINNLVLGVSQTDYSGYPDCRPSYYKAYNALIKEGTKDGDIEIITPVIQMKKEQMRNQDGRVRNGQGRKKLFESLYLWLLQQPFR